MNLFASHACYRRRFVADSVLTARTSTFSLLNATTVAMLVFARFSVILLQSTLAYYSWRTFTAPTALVSCIFVFVLSTIKLAICYAVRWFNKFTRFLSVTELPFFLGLFLRCRIVRLRSMSDWCRTPDQECTTRSLFCCDRTDRPRCFPAWMRSTRTPCSRCIGLCPLLF